MLLSPERKAETRGAYAQGEWTVPTAGGRHPDPQGLYTRLPVRSGPGDFGCVHPHPLFGVRTRDRTQPDTTATSTCLAASTGPGGRAPSMRTLLGARARHPPSPPDGALRPAHFSGSCELSLLLLTRREAHGTRLHTPGASPGEPEMDRWCLATLVAGGPGACLWR